MDYGKLISRAFQITFKYKFLWFLGILASLTSGGGYFPTYNFNFSELIPLFQEQPIPSETPTLSPERVLGAETVDWISTHLGLVLFLALLFFLLIIFLYVISTMAQGGLIASVLKIEKGEPVSFKIGLKEGYHAFWRMFGIGILIFLLFLIALMAFGLPILALILAKNYWFALGLGFLFLPILLLFSIYLGILSMYALRLTVCQKMGTVESIKSAHTLMMEHKKEIILVWLIAVAIGFVIALAFGLVVFVIIFPATAIGIGIYKSLGLLSTVIYSIIVGLILFLGLLLLGGIFQAFNSSFWTLAYLELSKKKTTGALSP